ncbi:hypothetical protein BLA50215_04156 [Burkholderia lata]|uniref:hypothetical protein n=1 Tax=Burkholderia lata (strain ATCC 17760 / DSM 23089 / LMG 22485 / NCIMB 9086 / R18194 / 383) TaxID=482957 RepID=UPI0014545428|nr:hypothetical protein [Burkholderia lata]VWD24150.1 hypothetical protein BLA50215_04156 [Burkholderia lata]
MVASLGILVPVEDDRFRAVVDSYGSALALPVHSEGVSAAGNPWHRFVVDGVTPTVHTGSGGKFPYPEFRPAMALRWPSKWRMSRRPSRDLNRAVSAS